MPYRHVASARIRQALPATSTSGLRLIGSELRGALRDQRVLLADVGVALLAHVDDHLAPLAERVGERALVGPGHGARAGAVAYPEVRHGSVPGVPRLDLAGELVHLARLGGGEQLARRARL